MTASSTTAGPTFPSVATVALLAPSTTKTPGGIARYTEGLLASGVLRKRRYTLTHICTHERGSKLHEVRLAIGAAARLPQCSRKARIAHALVASDASCVRKLLLLTEARFCGMKTLAHFHGSTLVEWLDSLPSTWRRLLIGAADRCNLVATLGNRLADYLRGHGLQSPIHIIPNGVDPAPAREPVAGRPPVILFVGRLGARKGTGDLLQSFAQLSDRYPEAKVVLMGDGEVDQAQRLAAELGIVNRVQCTGWASAQDVGRMMEQARVLVLPSYNENMALSVLEAMMRGLAVITTPVGEHRTVIEDGGDGLLVPSGDLVALRNALERVLVDPAFAEQLGRSARQKALREFDISVNHHRVVDLYDVLSGQSTANAIHRS
jgi:glycosyltransferase involved in cell wall biosynthesis